VECGCMCVCVGGGRREGEERRGRGAERERSAYLTNKKVHHLKEKRTIVGYLAVWKYPSYGKALCMGGCILN